MITKDKDQVFVSAKNGEFLSLPAIPLTTTPLSGAAESASRADTTLQISRSNKSPLMIDVYGNVPVDTGKLVSLTQGGLQSSASPDVFSAKEYYFLGDKVPFYDGGMLTVNRGHIWYKKNEKGDYEPRYDNGNNSPDGSKDFKFARDEFFKVEPTVFTNKDIPILNGNKIGDTFFALGG